MSLYNSIHPDPQISSDSIKDTYSYKKIIKYSETERVVISKSRNYYSVIERTLIRELSTLMLFARLTLTMSGLISFIVDKVPTLRDKLSGRKTAEDCLVLSLKENTFPLRLAYEDTSIPLGELHFS